MVTPHEKGPYEGQTASLGTAGHLTSKKLFVLSRNLWPEQSCHNTVDIINGALELNSATKRMAAAREPGPSAEFGFPGSSAGMNTMRVQAYPRGSLRYARKKMRIVKPSVWRRIQLLSGAGMRKRIQARSRAHRARSTLVREVESWEHQQSLLPA